MEPLSCVSTCRSPLRLLTSSCNPSVQRALAPYQRMVKVLSLMASLRRILDQSCHWLRQILRMHRRMFQLAQNKPMFAREQITHFWKYSMSCVDWLLHLVIVEILAANAGSQSKPPARSAPCKLLARAQDNTTNTNLETLTSLYSAASESGFAFSLKHY